MGFDEKKLESMGLTLPDCQIETAQHRWDQNSFEN